MSQRPIRENFTILSFEDLMSPEPDDPDSDGPESDQKYLVGQKFHARLEDGQDSNKAANEPESDQPESHQADAYGNRTEGSSILSETQEPSQEKGGWLSALSGQLD
jgi:hypothetical protein